MFNAVHVTPLPSIIVYKAVSYFNVLLCQLNFVNTPATQGRNPYYENDKAHSKWTPSTSDDDFSGSKHAIDLNPSQDDALGCPASDDVPYVYGCLNKFSFDLSWHYLNFWSAK